MNKTLFRMEWKSAWKLLLIFILILAMYFSIMLTMFDPELGLRWRSLRSLCRKMMAAVGMSGTAATLVDFFSTYLYGMIMIMFPFLFSVILSLRLLVKKVDNGSMTYLLSCGEKRSCELDDSAGCAAECAVSSDCLLYAYGYCLQYTHVSGRFGYCSLSAAESGMPAATDSIGVHQLSRFFRLE